MVKIYAAFHTANHRYSGNDRYSGIKSPDRFFHYSGRCLYFFGPPLYFVVGVYDGNIFCYFQAVVVVVVQSGYASNHYRHHIIGR